MKTRRNVPITITVVSNDTDVDGSVMPGTVAIVTLPRKGTASNGNGTVSYTPRSKGTDSFTYTVKDNSGAVSNQAKVTVTVR